MSLEFDSDRVYYISPEDHVDIIVYNGKLRAAARFLQNVRVTAVEPSAANAGKSMVQFAVSPQEAQYLAMFPRSGEVWLALRKKGDRELPPGVNVSWDSIMGSVMETVRKHQSYSASPDEDRAIQPLDNRSAVLAAVQERMRGHTYLALNLPMDSDKVAFIKPGDRIDILATLDMKLPRPQPKLRKATLSLLQYVTVLDVRRSETQPGRSNLLLELNGPSSLYAIITWSTADIRLITRNKKDGNIYSISPMYFEESLWASGKDPFMLVP